MIAYQGQSGAYSHLACQHVFPDEPVLACDSFVEAMMKVEKKQAALAMIPVENSTAGRVEEIYRLIPKMSLHIVGEHFEPVNHCLLARPGASIDSLTSVASHPQALAQCASGIEKLGLTTRAAFDTAGAAQQIAEGKGSEAAIASSLAAKLYNLDILIENFEDNSGNTTRFIILSHARNLPPLQEGVSYITSLIFKVRNIPAALYKTLGGFATNGINLAKLESYMPGGTLNSSQFHIDIHGHVEQPGLQLALEELNFFAEDVRLLGTYPAHPFRLSQAFYD
ncbi:MAG: prephenate dehydratase [Gammaproteobacteria bacterium]|nr:MAG: prephenate dehydratase [Pseudomonadota bacterium]PIE38836.1 MAG: prephenate dehydratase [Gammaproteobacteria bacterium]